MTNKESIKKLFNPEFVREYFNDKMPDFSKKHDLSDLTAKAIKRDIGGASFHIVARYDSASLKDRPIFCTAHSTENRQNAFRALLFIEKHGKRTENFLIPKPIFFDEKLRAFFYQGIDGENLLHYIKKGGCDLAEHMKNLAKWTARLHEIPIEKAENYNPENSKIETTVPGPEKFLPKIKKMFPEYFDEIKNNFESLARKEKKNLKSLDRKYLIHGDLHPENIIVAKDGRISVIDFTDVCLSDWARDIGNFIQQLGYMSKGHRNHAQTKMHQNLFYAEYLKRRGEHQTKSAQERVDLYKSWSALRSAIYFLIKMPPEEKNAKTVLEELKEIK